MEQVVSQLLSNNQKNVILKEQTEDMRHRQMGKRPQFYSPWNDFVRTSYNSGYAMSANDDITTYMHTYK